METANIIGSGEFKRVANNKEMFDILVQPACYNQCVKSQINQLLLSEMECTYKCMITYKQMFTEIIDNN